mgnify:CR=1 FL=1
MNLKKNSLLELISDPLGKKGNRLNDCVKFDKFKAIISNSIQKLNRNASNEWFISIYEKYKNEFYILKKDKANVFRFL